MAAKAEIPDDVAVLMLETAQAAHRVVYGRACDDRDPEDMIGDALVRMVKRYHVYDPSRLALKSWLWRQATGAFLDNMRERAHQRGEGSRGHMKRGDGNTIVSANEDMRAVSDDDYRTVSRLDLIIGDHDVEIVDWLSCELVQKALDQLKERERYALMLYVDGLKMSEIAALMQVTESRVSQLCTRAKAKLRVDSRMLLAAA